MTTQSIAYSLQHDTATLISQSQLVIRFLSDLLKTTDGPVQPAMDGPGVDPAAALSLEGPSLQRYAVRLSEVVMQQHAARKKDWKNWQGKEEELSDEIRELRRQVP